MSLTPKERKALVNLLEEHIKQVKKQEKVPSQQIALLSAEVKYEEFLEGIKKKIKKI
jgi:hypothetical protein|tara:strand:+ start:759 stop:929 length:171 start_codon:yes stop_codon:yes gene_type:complete